MNIPELKTEEWIEDLEPYQQGVMANRIWP